MELTKEERIIKAREEILAVLNKYQIEITTTLSAKEELVKKEEPTKEEPAKTE